MVYQLFRVLAFACESLPKNPPTPNPAPAVPPAPAPAPVPVTPQLAPTLKHAPVNANGRARVTPKRAIRLRGLKLYVGGSVSTCKGRRRWDWDRGSFAEKSRLGVMIRLLGANEVFLWLHLTSFAFRLLK